MSRPPSVDQARRTIDGAIEGEQIATDALGRINEGVSDPDAVLRLVLRAAAADGWTIPPGPTLRAACRRIQKTLEATHAAS